MTDCNLHIWWVGLSSSVIPEKFKSTPTPLFEQPLNFIIHGVLLGDYGIPVVSCIVLNKQCPSITLLLLWQIHYYYVSPPFQVMYSPISSRKWIKENVCDIHKCIHVYNQHYIPPLVLKDTILWSTTSYRKPLDCWKLTAIVCTHLFSCLTTQLELRLGG